MKARRSAVTNVALRVLGLSRSINFAPRVASGLSLGLQSLSVPFRTSLPMPNKMLATRKVRAMSTSLNTLLRIPNDLRGFWKLHRPPKHLS